MTTPQPLPTPPEIDPALDHPEHHMVWLETEIKWIKDYATRYAQASISRPAVAQPLAEAEALSDDAIAHAINNAACDVATNNAPDGRLHAICRNLWAQWCAQHAFQPAAVGAVPDPSTAVQAFHAAFAAAEASPTSVTAWRYAARLGRDALSQPKGPTA
jgi:hypothetical protein